MKTILTFLLIVVGFVAAFGQNAPITETQKRKAELVELKTLDKTFKLDIRYATANNFVGRAVYPEARAFLQKPAAEALVRVQKKLKKQGLGLVIFDGYRPWSITKLFWEVTPEDKKEFVADPKNGSRHNRGCAVDLSLYNLKTGANLPMPSEFDDFSERAYPNFEGATAEQKTNRELLRQTMESEGYTVYKSEWWHFDYQDWRNFDIYDIPFSVIGKIDNSPDNAKIKVKKDLEQFFAEAYVTGGIAVYDFKKNLFTVFDRTRFETPFSPASTSKVIHSLIFLDSGALKDENEVIKWDGVKRSVADWNQDLDLQKAFKVSAAWFYHEASKRITRETMQNYYDLSEYGNRNTNGFGEIYWVKGDLKVTPRQQIEFLVKLYKSSLPFTPQTVDKVKTMMIEEKTDSYTLRAKTGWSDAYTPQVGWWVGYVEKADNAYFFATEIDIKKDADAAKRKEITRKILKHLKII